MSLLFLFACHDFNGDLRLACTAPSASGAATADPADASRILGTWVNDNAGGEFSTWYHGLGMKAPAERAAAVREAAATAGIADCPLAEFVGR
ncbi:hypothetical protein LBMAG42_20410 [Deltaproteobacteria bacterium]|nr:hypothetical protein LBMAG42_20410 [Deltaproteobacteria bacterium]